MNRFATLRQSPWRISILIGSAIVLGAAAACKETTGNLPAAVARVAVAPETVVVIVAKSVALNVTPLDKDGKVLENRKATFATSDPTIAQVSSGGVVTGVRVGQTTITVTVGGVNAAIRTTVRPEPVARVLFDPAGSIQITEGGSSTITAKPQDANGNPLPDRQCNWSSSNPNTVSVQSTGLQTAKLTGITGGTTGGTVIITADCDGTPGTTNVTIQATTIPVSSVSISPQGTTLLRVGNTFQFTGTAKDAQGRVITGRPTTWINSNPLAVTVSNTGLVTAVAPGSATITVDIEQHQAQAQVVVTLIPVKSVDIKPDSFAVFESATPALSAGQTLTLTVRDSTGAIASPVGRSFNFFTSDITIAQVSVSTGNPQAPVAVGLTPGKAKIWAVVDTTTSDTILIDVRRINTASVAIIQTNIQLLVGTELQITAQALDSLGTGLPNGRSPLPRPITWTTSDPAIFTIVSQGTNIGRITAIKAGTATVTATCEGKSTTATVTVK